ncbi:MAG: 2-amino-4-hydroxy-6-hydroxymethyldihydropteridine diphosphokinase [Candidatus Omnitrophota bacterium]|jgi:2-amino-4-hydroxy-6-hydroxymethyldihydropteridine diphosphokinase
MIRCYIGIGSNLGDRHHNIQGAVRNIMMLAHTRVRKLSTIITSLPQGGPAGQGPYLNAALEIDTQLTPYQLLQELQRIESGFGRVRTVKDAPRIIDLDILTYGDITMNEEALCIPHPRILERDFVLLPLREIAPDEVLELIQRSKEPRKQRKKTLRPLIKKAKTKKKEQRNGKRGKPALKSKPKNKAKIKAKIKAKKRS